MNIRGALRSLFSKKLLALCVSAVLIPQAVNLLIKLTWAIIVILVLFLIFELCVVFVIKTWFPGTVNVTHVVEWTISTLLRIGNSLFNVVCHLMFSCFDLLFGNVFQTRRGTKNPQQRKQSESRKDSTTSDSATLDQLKASNKDGYTSMARIAMTNSAIRPSRQNRAARFSL